MGGMNSVPCVQAIAEKSSDWQKTMTARARNEVMGEDRAKTRKYQMVSESPAFFAAGRVFHVRRFLYKNQLYSTTHTPAAVAALPLMRIPLSKGQRGKEREGRVPMGILNGETRLLFCLPSEWSKMENWECRPKFTSTPIFTYANPATCNSNCKRN